MGDGFWLSGVDSIEPCVCVCILMVGNDIETVQQPKFLCVDCSL